MSKSTISQKATKILDMFKIRHWDKEFSTSTVKESNPFSNLMLINGIPFSKNNLPPNIRDLTNNFQSEGDLIKEYKEYRTLSNTLVSKIIDKYINEEVLFEAASLLNIAKGDQLFFNNILEKHTLIDFTLFDYKTNGKSFIAYFKNKINKNEKKLLENLLSSQTSLFKIKNVFVKEHILILEDLLNNQNDIKLIDINLSQTIKPGMILFSRLIPFKEFKITSGVNFAFQKTLEEKLINKYALLKDNIEHDDPVIKRFIAFFELNKMYGINVIPLVN